MEGEDEEGRRGCDEQARAARDRRPGEPPEPERGQRRSSAVRHGERE